VVDTGRVENVQRALATGTFQVDPPRVADKLLQLELIMSA
jgi:anti-sigma28 factor (negative regulator of flagellin synthesis)